VRPSRPYHDVTAYHREPGGLRRLDFFVQRLEKWQGNRLPSDIRILDIGCGRGNIALPLASLGYAVTGVDYDEDSIRFARDVASDLRDRPQFYVGSLEKIHGERFDVIVASEVLEHQKDPLAFLKELESLLNPNGLLLLSVPNGKSLEERIRKFTTHTKLGNAIKRFLKRGIAHEGVQSAASHPHEQFFSWKELRDLLYADGWKFERVENASAWFKEFFYLFGRLFVKRGSSMFHRLDAWDASLSPHLARSTSDGWLIEARRMKTKDPRVLHVIATLEPGGAEKLVLDLIERLPEKGFATSGATLFGGGPLEERVQSSHLPFQVIQRRGLFARKSFQELCERIASERPAIVHTHLFGADVLGRLAARLEGVPVILSTEHNVNLNHGGIKRFIKKQFAKITTMFVAVSSVVRDYMISADGVPAEKIRVIENGIEMRAIRSRGTGPFHDVPRLLTVGRLVSQKDHATLFKALALIKRPWRLEIVGKGENEKHLRELAERLGISSRIVWHGFRNDIPKLLAESDVFCFTSRWEGLGLAFIEAAAAGIPIVASDLPVFREVLPADVATYVPPGDVPAFAHAIDALLQDPDAAIHSAAGEAERVRKEYDSDRMVDRYAALYRELLKTHADSSR
jgi:glycosyltransferase involved in cell wall biosynthesis/2-polyprenyl-3-methyl-5-hydroxy-6-metoxy-1,4-benzoquinol methylase